MSDVWLTFAVAGVPGLFAIGAAVIAARAARRAQAAESDAVRLRELEGRIAERKHDTYRPMIEMLSGLLGPARGRPSEAQLAESLRSFAA